MGILTALQSSKSYLDANVSIYALEGYPEFRSDLTSLFEAIDRSELSTVTSELTLAELLVKPFQRNDIHGEAKCRSLVRHRPGLSVAPVGSETLVEAARLRAATGLRFPDAIHFATATVTGCHVFLTNDHRFRTIAGLRIVLLSEVAGR